MIQDGGGVYVCGPNWKGAGAIGGSGTKIKDNYVHDNPFSQQDGSPTKITNQQGLQTTLYSYAIYLETHSAGVTVSSNDTFDIRSGTGKNSDGNNGSRLGTQQAGPHANFLGVPVNSRSIINNAGPSGSTDLSAHLAFHKPQPSVTQTFALPYTGTYELAIRVAGVVGPGCKIAVSNPGVPGSSIFNLPAGSAAYSLLLPLSFIMPSPTSLDIQVTFAGGTSASLVLEKMWLVPTLVNPYAG